MKLLTSLLTPAVALAMIGEAHAVTLISNAFAGSNVSPTTLTAEATVIFGDNVSGPIGPGWQGSVNLPAGLLYDLSLEIDGPSGSLTVAGDGLAGLLGTITASKTFTGVQLSDNQAYQITLGRAFTADVSLLSNLGIIMGVDNGVTRTPVVNTSTGLGVGGTPIDLLGLLSANEDTTFSFTTGNVNNIANVYFEVSISTLAALVNSNVELTDLSLVAVPEPGVWSLLGAGALFAICVISFRKRRFPS